VTTSVSHASGGEPGAPKYRPDIDGLRAVAVGSVLGYHAFPDVIRGGFVGVDIFFIISGYLISTILLGNLEKGTYSFTQFYMRRILRIFPALLLVLLACFGFGWFELLGSEFKQLGKHIAGGAGFISNMILWRENGYFDNAAELKPLLHLWSLGIEEQFYIFWPVLLLVTWKLRVKPLPFMVVILVASFAENIHEIHTDTVGAFYSPLARFWELMIGGCLAYFGLHARDSRLMRTLSGGGSASSAAAALGAVLILLALTCLDKYAIFPGWWALLPTVGAMLIIGAGKDAWFNRRVLATKGMVAVGLISYPLYLWHWPLLSFMQITQAQKPSWWMRAGAVVAAIILATLTYQIIEKPLRFGRNKAAIAWVLLLCMCAVAGGGAAAYVKHGFPTRAMAKNSQEAQILDEDIKVRDSFAMQSCADDPRIIGRAKPFCEQSVAPANPAGLIVIWGDSHAGAWAATFLQLAKERNYRVIVFSALGCPPLLGVRRSDSLGATFCSKLGLGEDIEKSIEQLHPTDIVVVARWSLYANGWLQDGTLREATHFLTTSPDGIATRETSRAAMSSELRPTIDALLRTGAHVLLVKNPPVLKTTIGEGLLRRPDSFEPSAAENAEFERFGSQLIDSLSNVPNVDIFDPTAYFCGTGKCSAFYQGVPMYFDDNHLSGQGAVKLAGMVAPLVK
jgi:peptidoglycan/LPS O-acetylase OafA/YrhL